jgi:hypothetical protein
VIGEQDGRFRILFHVLDLPTRNLVPRMYRISDVIAEWRSAERRLAEIDPASEEAAALVEDIELLRAQRQVMLRQVEGRAQQSSRTETLSAGDLDALLAGGSRGDAG